jgi:transporter family protein
MGVIIGGLLPALLYSFGGLFQKGSVDAGIGVGTQMIIAGLATVVVGCGFYLAFPDKTISLRSGLLASGLGFSWGLATGFVAVAIVKFETPIAKLTPLYNMNTLIVVLLALWIFAEWKEVKVLQLLIGAVLIVMGGVLVARA